MSGFAKKEKGNVAHKIELGLLYLGRGDFEGGDRNLERPCDDKTARQILGVAFIKPGIIPRP